ncbi:methyltransferase domain-containing protein [bacterium]|nr:methyltransferase domain-containing protein [bacterium]
MTDASTESSNRLTTPEFWDAPFWSPGEDAAQLVQFDPENLEFRDIHRFWQKYLPCRSDWRFLEIGCHPGRYLWYFHQTFGYQVSGIEYAPTSCERTRHLMAEIGLRAEIEQADVFTYTPPQGRLFDVVCSVGLIEHFVDVGPIIERHVDLLAPGGYLVVLVPNHRGINGPILRWLQPEVYAAHNRMSYRMLLDGVLSHAEMRLVAGGYLGRFHLAPSNFCPAMQTRVSKAAYRWVDRGHRYAMRFGQWLPNTRWFSPYCGLIAQKQERS